jgi:hypothetical protein
MERRRANSQRIVAKISAFLEPTHTRIVRRSE